MDALGSSGEFAAFLMLAEAAATMTTAEERDRMSIAAMPADPSATLPRAGDFFATGRNDLRSAALVGIAGHGQETTNMTATSYRGYLIDHLNQVRSIVTIEAADLASACAQAETLLGQTRFAAIEIWDGSRIVGLRTSQRRARFPWPFGRRSDEIA